jgi:hypothetical protein
MLKLSLKKEDGWIGVDLDGTLAKYDGSVDFDFDHIGEPIEKMLNRVKKWIKEGKTVKIVTARAKGATKRQLDPIKKWLEENGIGGLEITNEKDMNMIELWDDRCVQVKTNTGERVDGKN